ncbi:cysteine desulfurase [Salipaludibacillus sp. CUR1]|uniref:cysteine desulfurase family protein n=1 Tax=Salipaludibacillus sp. CUR1 TaxID=2820003 RepID=UPI001E5CACCE|nr:cysteine desulfurase family protein [Salipaludibacillus sp. CUR1]MCE7793334.1 cysteine desulfurase [Salipaludibacillus sp. CUR1]
MIYFDNSATTVPYDEVINTFSEVSRSYFANPSSLHPLGREAERLKEQARRRVGSLLKVSPEELVFTSGGTEGNNLAIKGTAYRLQTRGKHIITTGLEHTSTFEACQQLEKEGFTVTYLTPDETGRITKDQVEQALTDDTILVTMIHVSNELGSVQPVQETGELLANYPKVLFHVDHVQGLTKVPLELKKAGIDLCTLSAHKFHGLKGTGALYVRRGINLTSQFSGGEQEGGYRGGTENLAGIVAMAKALRLSMEASNSGVDHIKQLSSWIEKEVSAIDGVVLNSPKDRAPHILNFSIPNMKPEVVIQALGEKGIFVSTKSACSSKQFTPSRVLLSAGFEEPVAASAIRLSFSFENTMEEAALFTDIFKEIVTSMKKVVKF